MRRRTKASSDWIAGLYDRHAAALYRYAVMILADQAGAADAVQQVFTKLVQGTTSELRSEQKYLRRAIRNECFSVLRRRRSEGQVGDSQQILEAVVAADEGGDVRIAVEQALRELPAAQREVVHLKIFEGLTFEEIANLTDESINTVASRYRYALEKMKERLGTE